MARGEFEAMRELHETMKSLTPEPFEWGSLDSGADPTYYFLCEFIHMDTKLPPPKELAPQIAALHKASLNRSMKFGFSVPTFHGSFSQLVGWDDSWASFFAKMLEHAFNLDTYANGIWEERKEIPARTLKVVVPQLLLPLESDGRQIKPCLIHGDLWDGNIGVERDSNSIKIFDSGAYYAHNEMELGMWRCERHQISKDRAYTEEYLKYFPPSEPTDQWDDRNRLYCVKMNIIHSAHHRCDPARQT